jgi:signal transduction histidine kinase
MFGQTQPLREAPEWEHEIRERFGLLPNFFRLTPEIPQISLNLWHFAEVAYLDNPLPSLFKERLFVYLSRFCEVRYCIARHVGFLVGLGRPAGDAQARIQTVEEVVRLLRRSLPGGNRLKMLLFLAEKHAPLRELPDAGSDLEEAFFAIVSHVFLQTSEAPVCLDALKALLDELRLQYLLLFLLFIRGAHYWTEVHPELVFEEDINQLMATHKGLAECILDDPEALTAKRGSTPAVAADGSVARRQLIEAQEQERDRIGRELHDNSNQRLGLLAVQIEQLKDSIPHQAANVRRSLDAIHKQTLTISTDIEVLSHELHSSRLEYLGLALTIKDFCKEFGAKHNVEIDFDCHDISPTVPREISLCLFRVVQEGLRDALTHRGARFFEVKLYGSPTEIRLTIRHSGAGFEPESGEAQELGLISMQERIRLVKGTISTNSRSQSGTEINVRIPSLAEWRNGMVKLAGD